MLDDLTEDELAALDDIPSDAVDHWSKGELWDSKTKTWKRNEAAPQQNAERTTRIRRDSSGGYQTTNGTS